jgi:hypothetical protein
MALLSLNPAIAQEVGEGPELQPLPEEISARFDQMLADIENQKEDIASTEARLGDFEGTPADILSARRDRVWTSMFHKTLQLARDVAAQQDSGKDVSAYRDHLISELSELPDEAYDTLQHLRSRVEFPSTDLPPEKFVVADHELFKRLREVDDVFRALIAYVQIAEKFDLEASEERAFMEQELTDAAANRSVFLELALDDVAMLRSAITTLPGNENLTSWLNAAQTRVQMTAKAMQGLIALMKALGLETRQYRQQVLTATGEITTDVLDVGIVGNLVSQWSKASVGLMVQEGPRLIFRLLLVLFILFVFFQVAKLVQKGVERALGSARVSISHLLRRMIVSTARNLIIIFGVLIAIQ